ncbi:E3 ubiquitin protein ligase UPL2-like protein [Tanacetum coccineum]
MYGPSVHVLVRKDAEFSSSHGGGIFHHILGSFLPHSRTSKREKKTDADWSDFADNCKVQRSPRNDIQAFVDLLDDVLAARSRARSPTSSLIFGEASATFIDVGLVRSLTRTLHLLDLDHAESLKVAPALVKVLELGGFSSLVKSLRAQCIELLTQIESRLDFDDEMPPLDMDLVLSKISAMSHDVESAMETANYDKFLQSGLQVRCYAFDQVLTYYKNFKCNTGWKEFIDTKKAHNTGLAFS